MGAIGDEVCGWPGVTAAPHRFGGIEFRVAGHEIGHLHGERLADLPFPVRMRQELVESGRALPHHVLPQSGWVSYRIHSPEDVPGAIALFRLNYERIVAAAAEGSAPETAEEAEVSAAEPETAPVIASDSASVADPEPVAVPEAAPATAADTEPVAVEEPQPARAMEPEPA